MVAPAVGWVRDLTSEGYGVVEADAGPVVLLPFVLEGEEVQYAISHRKRRLQYGYPLAILTPSPHRTQPVCQAFGQCGGCRWQMMTYEHQLEVKRDFVERQLRHIGHLSVSVPPVQPSPQPYQYRNKVEYAFGRDEGGQVMIGFHPRGDFWKVLPIEACQIVPPAFEDVRRQIQAQARILPYASYDPKRHTGLWRELLIRGTPESYIVLVSLAEDNPDLAHALLKPLQTWPACQGAGYFYNPKRNNSLFDLVPRPLWGDLELTYIIGGRQFRLGPKDFFQVHLAQAEALILWLRHRLSETPALYDLYGGVGFLGISLAEKAQRLILVEKLPEAVESARKNFLLNQHHYSQTIFEGFVGALETHWSALKPLSEAIAIVDPPREGLHPTLQKALRQGPFGQIFYVSCHPATQARDLAMLSEAYEVTEVQPFDLFPQTTAIENVAWLVRKR